MKEVVGDLWETSIAAWELETRAVVITTNTHVVSDKGRPVNPMGGGCAREAADKYPSLPFIYGVHVLAHGLDPLALQPGFFDHSTDTGRTDDQPWWLIMMPTINQGPGADWTTIRNSAKKIVDLVDMLPINEVIVPRPGCGIGGLKWEEVGPALDKIWDHRFHCITQPVLGEVTRG